MPLDEPDRLPDDLRRELAAVLGRHLTKVLERKGITERISMPIAGVVADANVPLSAVVGKAALRVFTKFEVVVHVAQFNTDEVDRLR